MIDGFKTDCVLSFFKVALIKNSHGILTKPGAQTQAARTIRFTSAEQVIDMEPLLKDYISQAIEVEKTGLKVQFKSIAEHTVPDALQQKPGENPALEQAFSALIPGRQRAYILHIGSANQAATRSTRVENASRKSSRVRV